MAAQPRNDLLPVAAIESNLSTVLEREKVLFVDMHRSDGERECWS